MIRAAFWEDPHGSNRIPNRRLGRARDDVKGQQGMTKASMSSLGIVKEAWTPKVSLRNHDP